MMQQSWLLLRILCFTVLVDMHTFLPVARLWLGSNALLLPLAAGALFSVAQLASATLATHASNQHVSWR
jgi:hypothetical protein